MKTKAQMFFVIFLLELAFVTVPASVIFEDCGSGYELYTVNIDGCGMRLPCYVTLGENVPVSVEFYADFESRKLDQDVVININLVNLNADVTPEACETVDCPVKTNARTSFTSVMTVPPRMAVNQRGYLRWRVYNESGKVVLCYSVLVQTQSPMQKLLRQALADVVPEDELDTIANSIDNPGSPQLNVPNELFLQQIIDRYYMKRHIVGSNDGD